MKIIFYLKTKFENLSIYLKIILHFMINEFTFLNIILTIKLFIIKFIK